MGIIGFVLTLIDSFILAVLGLSCSMWVLHCGVWDLSLQYKDTLVLTCRLESAGLVGEAHGLICSEARGILVPWPGIEPMFPAFQGGFLTSGPPEKSLGSVLKDDRMFLGRKQERAFIKWGMGRGPFYWTPTMLAVCLVNYKEMWNGSSDTQHGQEGKYYSPILHTRQPSLRVT